MRSKSHPQAWGPAYLALKCSGQCSHGERQDPASCQLACSGPGCSWGVPRGVRTSGSHRPLVTAACVSGTVSSRCPSWSHSSRPVSMARRVAESHAWTTRPASGMEKGAGSRRLFTCGARTQHWERGPRQGTAGHAQNAGGQGPSSGQLGAATYRTGKEVSEMGMCGQDSRARQEKGVRVGGFRGPYQGLASDTGSELAG